MNNGLVGMDPVIPTFTFPDESLFLTPAHIFVPFLANCAEQHSVKYPPVPVESDSDPVVFSNRSLPADADFLICFVSAPGHQSYRQASLGSCFINAVFEVFKEHAEREHIMDMMLKVNNQVAGYFSKDGLKQMPCQVCMLTKKCFFNQDIAVHETESRK